MANTFKSVTSGSIGTGLTDVYTCPGSTTTMYWVHQCQIQLQIQLGVQ